MLSSWSRGTRGGLEFMDVEGAELVLQVGLGFKG